MPSSSRHANVVESDGTGGLDSKSERDTVSLPPLCTRTALPSLLAWLSSTLESRMRPWLSFATASAPPEPAVLYAMWHLVMFIPSTDSRETAPPSWRARFEVMSQSVNVIVERDCRKSAPPENSATFDTYNLSQWWRCHNLLKNKILRRDEQRLKIS